MLHKEYTYINDVEEIKVYKFSEKKENIKLLGLKLNFSKFDFLKKFKIKKPEYLNDYKFYVYSFEGKNEEKILHGIRKISKKYNVLFEENDSI